MAFDSIRPERELFGFGSALGTVLKYLYSAILCTGRTNYANIWITWRWNNFRWKLILRMKANLRNVQPTKYKCFTVLIFQYMMSFDCITSWKIPILSRMWLNKQTSKLANQYREQFLNLHAETFMSSVHSTKSRYSKAQNQQSSRVLTAQKEHFP